MKDIKKLDVKKASAKKETNAAREKLKELGRKGVAGCPEL